MTPVFSADTFPLLFFLSLSNPPMQRATLQYDSKRC